MSQHVIEISKPQKSKRDTSVYCRDLTRLCLRLRIEVKLRAASGRPIAYHPKQATPVIRGLCLKRGRSRPTGTLRGNGPSSSTGRGVAVAWSSKVQNQNHQVPGEGVLVRVSKKQAKGVKTDCSYSNRGGVLSNTNCMLR